MKASLIIDSALYGSSQCFSRISVKLTNNISDSADWTSLSEMQILSLLSVIVNNPFIFSSITVAPEVLLMGDTFTLLLEILIVYRLALRDIRMLVRGLGLVLSVIYSMNTTDFLRRCLMSVLVGG